MKLTVSLGRLLSSPGTLLSQQQRQAQSLDGTGTQCNEVAMGGDSSLALIASDQKSQGTFSLLLFSST